MKWQLATATATAANFEGPIGNGEYRRVAPASDTNCRKKSTTYYTKQLVLFARLQKQQQQQQQLVE